MLTELYCIIDDFGKLVQKNLGEKKLLDSTKTRNVMTTTLSKIATITLFFITTLGTKTLKLITKGHPEKDLIIKQHYKDLSKTQIRY